MLSCRRWATGELHFGRARVGWHLDERTVGPRHTSRGPGHRLQSRPRGVPAGSRRRVGPQAWGRGPRHRAQPRDGGHRWPVDGGGDHARRPGDGPAAAGGSTPVILHDYHLMLVAPYLRALVPDGFIYHFTHIPWCQPDLMRVLPARIGVETLEGMLANDLLGFQAVRWARNFMWCCQDLLRAEIDFDAGLIRYQDRQIRVRHYPIAIDVESLRAIVASEEATQHVAWLDGILEGRKLVLRIDRMELSKNIVRGLRAFEELLREHQEWRGEGRDVAPLDPSRRAPWEYRAHQAGVLDA